jgi:hypothetical protein
MIALSMSLRGGIKLARADPSERYSLEKLFDYVRGRLPGLSKLVGITALAPDPR